MIATIQISTLDHHFIEKNIRFTNEEYNSANYDKVNSYIYNYVNNPSYRKAKTIKVEIRKTLDSYMVLRHWEYKPTYR